MEGAHEWKTEKKKRQFILFELSLAWRSATGQIGSYMEGVGVRGGGESFRKYLVRPKVLRKSSASERKRQKRKQEKIYTFMSQADPTRLHSSPRIKT